MNDIMEMKRTKLGAGIRVISFFTGAGGLDLGFDYAGYDVVYATDIDSTCCETLKSNLGKELSKNTVVEKFDIRKIDPETLPKNIDLIIGGPPCQSFSASGRRAGGAPGRLIEKGTLFEAYCKIIDHVQPKAFLFENVRGILGTNKGEDWEVIVKAFRDIGFNISYRILDTLDYGAPQQRERMLMVGHRLDTDFLFPQPTHGPDSDTKAPYLTAGKAISDIKFDDEDKSSLILDGGKYSHLLPQVPPGENYLFFTAKRGHENPTFAYRSRFSDFLYKADPETPIKTLIASPGKYTGPFHWDNRCFTTREYMRLQGFPDGYIFTGSRSDQVKQIGNSVSPKLAYALAKAIGMQIFNRQFTVKLLPSDYVLSFDKRKGAKAAKTRLKHTLVAQSKESIASSFFRFDNYESHVKPYSSRSLTENSTASAEKNIVDLKIRADASRKLFAKLKIAIYQGESLNPQTSKVVDAILNVSVYGESEHTVQTMWNGIDDWVRRSSNFHSLFELYGHFTEPHPIFEILDFQVKSNAPICEFAYHVANFHNCSRYFPRRHLTDLFGVKFGTENFVDLVKKLRKFRFDIRCHETNIAIPPDVYMVSYPFTLPFGKQMNFSLNDYEINHSELTA